MEATVRLLKRQIIKMKMVSTMSTSTMWIKQTNETTSTETTATEVHHVKPSGTLTIENNNVETGTFDAVIRNVVAPNGLKEVLIPTWSDKNWSR